MLDYRRLKSVLVNVSQKEVIKITHPLASTYHSNIRANELWNHRSIDSGLRLINVHYPKFFPPNISKGLETLDVLLESGVLISGTSLNTKTRRNRYSATIGYCTHLCK